MFDSHFWCNFSQFCQFLFQKHAGFRLETLPFEGRNIAIWWDGETLTCDPDSKGPAAALAETEDALAS